MRRAVKLGAFVLAFVLGIRAIAWWHGRDAQDLYEGEAEAQRALIRGMDHWTEAELTPGDFGTGNPRFDGEWLFATRMMAALGYAQTALAHPALREANARRINRCLDALRAPRSRAFDRRAWGHDPLADLGSRRAHMGYLGYLALALSLGRLVDPEFEHAALEQRVIEHLSRRLERSSLGLVETYPGEVYPIDNTAFFGALAVHDRATGQDHAELLERLLEGLERYRDDDTGLLYQRVDPRDGAPRDLPRGSGTALAGYFLSFADPELSRSLYDAIRTHLQRSTLGFGTTREYPPGREGGGDIDSGPVVLGQSTSATGFTLALARIHRDRDTFVRTYATASVVGGPVALDGVRYALGGPIGDALLFALTTALPAQRWSER